jgi:hypothetical protein
MDSWPSFEGMENKNVILGIETNAGGVEWRVRRPVDKV